MSVSSHDGSEKDSGLFHRMSEGFPHRYAAMRKTDLLDTLDVRHRDTDTWSVAATIDDQESVISGAGGTASIVSSSRATVEGRETDDDRSTLDGGGNASDAIHPALLTSFRLETLRDLDGGSGGGGQDTASTIDDNRSRSNAAEFGDEGTRSAATDFDQSDTSDDEQGGGHQHRVVNDDISAPPQPQPSFASVTKSFAELMEENEALHTQLRNLQIAQKHQSELIENLRSLTNCNEEVYGQALHLSQVTPEELERWNQQSRVPSAAVSSSSTGREQQEATSAHSLAQQLARLAELVTRYTQLVDHQDDTAKIRFEQDLFAHIVSAYFDSLPFGTENQELLNLAYSDQMRRFQTTLGAHFAKWYRRQTVQSLSLNPASKEHLERLRIDLTDKFYRNQHKQEWDELLEHCAALSLVIHAGDADVTTQQVEQGAKYDPHIMAVVGDERADDTKSVKTVLTPLFINEEQVVLMPARVILQ